ncbi:hypothetical protein RYX36_002331 [Vicia faba]
MGGYSHHISSTMKEVKKNKKDVDKKKRAEIPDLMSKIDYKLSLEISYNLKKAQPLYLYSNNNLNKVEEASLILGLYIFGKDFVKVKRFIGTKSIGELKTFYYTKFYPSEDHKKWRIYKEARETIRGFNKQKLFTKVTHQHFLSRLLHNESVEHCCNKLLEVIKNFLGGNLKLEEYVFALKDLVGVEALIDAVGIGKENDLTSPGVNSMKSIYDPNVVRVSASEDRFRNQAVETVRKSKRNTKPLMKALEAVVDKMGEESSRKRMRR